MRVLVAAYSCGPDRGSEPGIGWNWVLQIAGLGHETHVITRQYNRPAIAAAQAAGRCPPKLHFHYYDLNPLLCFWERGERAVYLYYPMWQWGAANLALRLHRRLHFDLVHHLTFGSVRFPSFMGRLGIPFILGPMGGGEFAPRALRRGYPLQGKMVETLRDVSNAVVQFDPLMRMTYRQADRILLRTRDNIPMIPRKQRHKIEVRSEIGIDPVDVVSSADSSLGPLRVLYAGRFLYWKGMHLGLAAFARLVRSNPDVRLTMVGKGPQEDAWRELAEHLGVADNIDWLGWVPREHMAALYARHDVFLFPSLHDSGGTVVLEAAIHGLPIVCLDLGGPGALVKPEFGLKVSVEGKTQDDVIAALSAALEKVCTSTDLRHLLSQAAFKWAAKRDWPTVVQQVYPTVLRATT